MKKLMILAALGAVAAANAQSMLGVGDLAVVGFNTDDNDFLAVLTLKDLASGTQFGFFDYGVKADNSLRYGGEGWVSTTLGGSVALGTVICFERDSAGGWVMTGAMGSVNWDTAGSSTASDANFSTSGDQFFLYQGMINDVDVEVDPNNSFVGGLIHGVNADNGGSTTTGWQTDATSSNTSAQPASLVGSSVGLFTSTTGEFDNARYTGPKNLDAAGMFAAINDRANWTSSNDRIATDLMKEGYQVVPEPATLIALGLGAAAMLRRRRNAR